MFRQRRFGGIVTAGRTFRGDLRGRRTDLRPSSRRFDRVLGSADRSRPGWPFPRSRRRIGIRMRADRNRRGHLLGRRDPNDRPDARRRPLRELDGRNLPRLCTRLERGGSLRLAAHKARSAKTRARRRFPPERSPRWRPVDVSPAASTRSVRSHAGAPSSRRHRSALSSPSRQDSPMSAAAFARGACVVGGRRRMNG